jgi:hypothetical protein
MIFQMKPGFGLSPDAVTAVEKLGTAPMREILVTADNPGDVSNHFLKTTNIGAETGSY